MLAPNVTKSNSRFRGPQESKKLMAFDVQVSRQIKVFKEEAKRIEDMTILQKPIKINFMAIDLLTQIEDILSKMEEKCFNG